MDTAFDRWFPRIWLAGFIAAIAAYMVANYYYCSADPLPVELIDVCEGR